MVEKRMVMIMGIIMLSIVGSMFSNSFAISIGNQQQHQVLQQEKKQQIQQQKYIIQHDMQQLLQTLPVRVGTEIQHEIKQQVQQ